MLLCLLKIRILARPFSKGAVPFGWSNVPFGWSTVPFGWSSGGLLCPSGGLMCPSGGLMCPSGGLLCPLSALMCPQHQDIFSTHLNYFNLKSVWAPNTELSEHWTINALLAGRYTGNRCLALTITIFKMRGVVMRYSLCFLVCKFCWEHWDGIVETCLHPKMQIKGLTYWADVSTKKKQAEHVLTNIPWKVALDYIDHKQPQCLSMFASFYQTSLLL